VSRIRLQATWFLWTLAASFLFASGGLQAQESKPQPPPTRLPTREDTLHTSEKQSPKASVQERSRLELPDVLIVGQDRTRRLSGEKLYGGAVSVQLRERHEEYKPVRFSLQTTGQKKTGQRPSRLRSAGFEWLASYGDFRSARALATHWAQRDRWSYQLSGNFDRSSGQYPNSEYTVWALSGRASRDFSETASARAALAFGKQRYGMNSALVDRKAGFLDLSADGNKQLSSKLGLRFDASYRSLDLSQMADVVRAPVQWRSSGHWTHFDVTGDASLGVASLAVSLGYTGNRFRPADFDSLKSGNDLTTLGAELDFPVAERASVAVGAELATHKPYRGQRSSRAFYLVRAALSLSEQLGMFAEARSGYRLLVPHRLWLDNRFLDPFDIDWGAERVEPEIALGGELRLVRGTRIRVKVSRATHFNAPYWKMRVDTSSSSGSTGTTVFGLGRLAKLERNLVSLGLDFFPSPAVDVSVDLNQISEELAGQPFAPALPGFSRRPFLPHWSVPIRVSWRAARNVRLGLLGTWIKGRSATLDGSQTLPDYVSLEANAEVLLTKGVMLRLEVRNLLNDSIVLWPGHPEFGRLLALGLHGTW